jgi:hypothetical protein
MAFRNGKASCALCSTGTTPTPPVASETLEANCLGTDAVGDWVHVTAEPAGGLYQVEKVDVTDLATMPSIGVIISKSSVTDCVVQTAGIVTTSGLSAGVPYVIGLDSQSSSSPPTPAPSEKTITQGVGTALSSTELLIAFDLIRIKRGSST